MLFATVATRLLPHLPAFIVGLLLSAALLPATVYYVSPTGSDNAAGTTPQTAWRTLAQVQSHAWSPGFAPGDQILFEGGAVFTGTLYIQPDRSGGTADNPITVGSYGSGRATLTSNSGDLLMLWIPSGERLGFHIRDLNLVATGSAGHGLLVWNGSSSRVDYLRLTNLYVSGARRDGISIGRSTGAGRITNVVIRDCVAFSNTGTAGFSGPSGSGIVLGGADGGLIEYCRAYDNGAANTNSAGPVGIWTWDSNNVIIQHSISHDNKTNGGDGGGFDIDGGSTNCVIQYCYSYNNYGSGYLLAQYDGAAPMGNNHIRFNLSINDGRKGGYGAIDVWGHNGTPSMTSAYIYNNTVYMTPPAGNGPAYGLRAWHRYTGIRVFNNIFYLSGDNVRAVTSTRTQANDIFFLNNAWYHAGPGALDFTWGSGGGQAVYATLAQWAAATGQETQGGLLLGREGDPRLSLAGSIPALTDPSALASLAAYQLLPASPLIDRGLDLTQPSYGVLDPGARDFWGNALPQGFAFDIGAHARGTSFFEWISGISGLAEEDYHPLADPDQDGLPNFLEYAFVSHPNDPADRAEPLLSTVDIDGQPHLTLTYRRLKDPAAAGLAYIVETSPTLAAGSWASDPALFIGHALDTSPADHDLVTVRLATPLIPGSPQFLRVRVTTLD